MVLRWFYSVVYSSNNELEQSCYVATGCSSVCSDIKKRFSIRSVRVIGGCQSERSKRLIPTVFSRQLFVNKAS